MCVTLNQTLVHGKQACIMMWNICVCILCYKWTIWLMIIHISVLGSISISISISRHFKIIYV